MVSFLLNTDIVWLKVPAYPRVMDGSMEFMYRKITVKYIAVSANPSSTEFIAFYLCNLEGFLVPA